VKKTYGTCYPEENQAMKINEFKKYLEMLWRTGKHFKREKVRRIIKT